MSCYNIKLTEAFCSRLTMTLEQKYVLIPYNNVFILIPEHSVTLSLSLEVLYV